MVSASRSAWIALAFVAVLRPGPAVAAQRDGVRALSIRGWRASLELESDFLRTDTDQAGRERSESLRRLTEGLRVETAGTLYHPRFLTFDLSGLLSFQQASLESEATSFDRERRIRLGGYSSRVSLLPQRAGHAQWSADRSRTRTRVTEFQERSVDIRRQTWSLFWGRRPVPLDFRYEVGRRRHSGTFGSDERTWRTLLSGRLREGRTSAGFRLERTRQRDDVVGYALTRHAGDLHASYGLGGWQLNSAARWWRQDLDGRTETTSGSFGATRELGLGFRTSADVDLRRNDRDAIREDTVAGRFSILHQLYESLDTDATVRVRRQTPDGTSLRTLDLETSTRYRKRVPHGKLFLDGSVERLSRDTEGGDAVSNVIDRRLRFDDSDLLLLADPDVDPQSLRITDSTGTVLFRPDVDYEADFLPGGTLLRRLPSGAIPSRGLISVSFQFRTESTVRQELETIQGGVRLRADTGLYVRASATKSYPTRDVEGGTIGFTPSRWRVFGAGWTGRFARADWEDFRKVDEILPYDRDRITLHAGTALGPGSTWSVDAARSVTTFPGRGESFEARSLRGQIRHTVGRRGTWTIEGGVRKDEGESGDTDGWFLSNHVSYSHPIGDLDLEWREEDVSSESVSTHRTSRLFLEFRRRLR